MPMTGTRIRRTHGGRFVKVHGRVCNICTSNLRGVNVEPLRIARRTARPFVIIDLAVIRFLHYTALVAPLL